MTLKPKQDLLRIAMTQLFILNIAWAFYIVVSVKNPLPLPDATAMWAYRNPIETTFVVTMIATVISSITIGCFTQAAKHALRQYLDNRRSISLANLSIGIALASASFTFKRGPRNLGPTLGTLIIAVVFGLVNSAWTTFLNPAQVNVLVFMNGEELDVGNQEFDTVLGRDVNNTFGFSNGTLVTQPNSANSLTSVAFTGGLTNAAAYASGQPGILIFNNVVFNVSTGGILSAVAGYGPRNAPSISDSGSPAAFGGGPVPTNLDASASLTGISRTYNIIQQGLTANVSCFNYTDPAEWYPIDIQAISVNATFEMDGYVSGILPVVNTTLPRMSCNSNISGEGMIASMAAVNFNNSNYLASVVCPYTWQDALNAERIVVYHSGVGKYAALPPTICEIVLLLTRSSVTYANQQVTSIPQTSMPISYQHNLNYWVAMLIELEEWGFQTARVNSVGNMLLSLLTSGSPTFSETPVHSYQMFLQEYWKGVIEVTGTALRSGYTAYSQNVTSMKIPMNGTQIITTMGWSFHSRTWVYALVPITLTAVMTFAAIIFALYHIRRTEKREERLESKPVENGVPRDSQLGRLVVPHTEAGTFDASDPVHLLVASAARQVAPGSHGKGYWEQYNENVVIFQLNH
ncbi:hypothetical protein OG21DRAFT_608473 [Imleria badia]|nr:hypothetical protein OG21DRAFT_608473 [Imleria badia]